MTANQVPAPTRHIIICRSHAPLNLLPVPARPHAPHHWPLVLTNLHVAAASVAQSLGPHSSDRGDFAAQADEELVRPCRLRLRGRGP